MCGYTCSFPSGMVLPQLERFFFMEYKKPGCRTRKLRPHERFMVCSQTQMQSGGGTLTNMIV